MEETLTLTRLGVRGSLKRTLESTNPCESMIECVRRSSRNVKRWQSGDMALRWTAAGMLGAERQFRRIIGYRDLAKLAVAIEHDLARHRHAATATLPISEPPCLRSPARAGTSAVVLRAVGADDEHSPVLGPRETPASPWRKQKSGPRPTRRPQVVRPGRLRSLCSGARSAVRAVANRGRWRVPVAQATVPLSCYSKLTGDPLNVPFLTVVAPHVAAPVYLSDTVPEKVNGR